MTDSAAANLQTPKNPIIVSAPGKIILHGEHSVVFGKLAIAASLDLRTTLKLTETSNSPLNSNLTSTEPLNLDSVTSPETSIPDPTSVTFALKALNLIKSFDVRDLDQYLLNPRIPLKDNTKVPDWRKPEEIDHEELLKQVENFVHDNSITTNCELTAVERLALVFILYLYTAIFGCFNLKAAPFRVDLETQLSVSAGLGSSASFAVATVAAFLRHANEKTTRHPDENVFNNKQNFIINPDNLDLISRWAFCAEKIVHGTPSGIDNTVCTFGSMVAFRKGGTFKTIEHPKLFRVLLINTKVPKSTKQLVAKVADRKQNFGIIVEPILEAMEGICQSAEKYLGRLWKFDQDSNIEGIAEIYGKLGEITDMNQCLLKSLGVSHKSIDLICSILCEFGLHCKLTGAGGGGYCVALIPPKFNQDTLDEAIEQLKENGFEVFDTNLGGSGVTFH